MYQPEDGFWASQDILQRKNDDIIFERYLIGGEKGLHYVGNNVPSAGELRREGSGASRNL
jgi:hypothetical protein